MKRHDETQLPKTLYKYGDWDKENDKRRLTHNELYFPSMLHFNDPFDRGVPWRYDLETAEKLKEHSLRIAKQSFPTFSPKQHELKANEGLTNQLFANPAHRRNAIEEHAVKHGVLSLSARPDSVLMWSHYCNSHKGFCLGFHGPELQQFLRNRFNLTKRIPVWYPVEYVDEYPNLLPSEFVGDPELFFARPITLKSSDWGYEKEWRCILMEHCNVSDTYENYILKEVIVGAEACEKTVEEIRDAIRLKKSTIGFLRCVRKMDDFGMYFETIEIE